MLQQRFAEALPIAKKALLGERRCVTTHGMVALILLRLGRWGEADSVILEAMELPPGVAEAYDALAFASFALGQHERATALYRRAIDRDSVNPKFWYNLASSERSLGHLSEAEAACDRAIALDASQYPSYLLRSELRVQTSDYNHIAELRSQITRASKDYRARMFLGYAMAKELDDLGCFDEAFHWFSEGARARRRHLSYDVAADERKLCRITECFPTQYSRPAASDSSGHYIFIVGLPRSGTTLVERILTGLPGVRSNGETDNFMRALLSAAPPGDGDVFAQAALADPGAVAAQYSRLADAQSSTDLIIEKLPMNYLYLGAIHRALPRAKLILVSRSPLDSCFAMFRTLFGEGYPFTYDFEELARYYAAYHRLIRHWRASLADGLYEISYDQLVTTPDEVGSGIARYCGLPWTAAALELQKNTAVSLTASAAQIRRPIYTTSSGRWRHYRRQLGPLVAALRDYGVAVDKEL
jgi:tetratricopeptide (TPR) repeat protein